MTEAASIAAADRGAAERVPGRVVYTSEAIGRRVRSLGAQIAGAYPGESRPLMLGLLKGSFIFLADLVRCIERPVEIDFLVAASYGRGVASTGDVRTLYEPSASLEDRHVVLVEDIVDSGHTINELVPALRSRGPASLEVCALLHKHRATDLALEPRWVGFDAPPEFLVGYGLDRAEEFRHLPYIASV